MRISDWSSDVCSSDLFHHREDAFRQCDIQAAGGPVATGPIALPERCHDAECTIEASDRVSDAHTNTNRGQVETAGGMVGQMTQSADSLANYAEGGAITIRACLPITRKKGRRDERRVGQGWDRTGCSRGEK